VARGRVTASARRRWLTRANGLALEPDGSPVPQEARLSLTAGCWSAETPKLPEKEPHGSTEWLRDTCYRRSYYVVGLDGDKLPIDSLTSNLGHLLWSGIVPEERARTLADHLMSDDLPRKRHPASASEPPSSSRAKGLAGYVLFECEAVTVWIALVSSRIWLERLSSSWFCLSSSLTVCHCWSATT
jgi:hypothetical protein